MFGRRSVTKERPQKDGNSRMFRYRVLLGVENFAFGELTRGIHACNRQTISMKTVHMRN